MRRFAIKNRTKFLAYATLVLMAIFVLRLFQMQILQHDYYASIATSEQTKKWEIPAVRGEIYAMDNATPKKIVLNETTYTLWVDPSVIIDKQKVIETIRAIAGGNLVANASDLVGKADTQYQVIAHDLTYAQANKIKSENLYGVGFEASTRRVYPEGQLASQVLGFVNSSGVGQYGIEGQLNGELTGQKGLLKTVTDVRDVPLTIGKDNVSIAPVNGKNIVLTLDENVQNEAEKVLPRQLKKIGATYGSILVMDPNNGHVLAMANYPTFNPEKIDQVKSSNIGVFNNPIISDPYEPASVMKTMTMATGIDQGVMTPKSTFNNTGQITIDGFTINNASKLAEITGRVSMQTALTWSLNTGTVTMAQWLGGGTINQHARNTLYNYYHDKFRLGELTGIQLQGESPGIIVAPNGSPAPALRYANMTFGQGLDVTSLQVASAFSTVINGGIYYKPTIVAGSVDGDGVFHRQAANAGERVIRSSTSEAMVGMLHSARQNFGYNALDPNGYYIGGKTGTAQAIVNGKYTFDTTTGTYVGFGATPGQKPAYVVLVHAGRPGAQIGSELAIQIFNPMSNFMINYLKLAPKG